VYSTLLDILANRKDPRNVSGSLLVNGKPHDETFNRVAGYVTQDDCLAGLLTVEETLRFYANLKLPSSVSAEEKARKVTRLINKLGLDKVRSSATCH
jgi:ATP-binding cassette, subfamily G (WHITE), member 2